VGRAGVRPSGGGPGRPDAAKAPYPGENEKAKGRGREHRGSPCAAGCRSRCRSRSEVGFFASLKARGLASGCVRATINPGGVTGYRCRAARDKTAKGGQVWYGGGRLAAT